MWRQDTEAGGGLAKLYALVDFCLQGELQLNVHQQRYIAKTKEEEIVNAIIDLAKYGEQ